MYHPEDTPPNALTLNTRTGLWELNMDGSYKQHHVGGGVIPTYTADDIREFSRVWTGWDLQAPRNNVGGIRSENHIDPMRLYPLRRDRFPKTVLRNGASKAVPLRHLGDTYPLCSELPPRHYLMKGAKYRFTGQTSMLGAAADNHDEKGQTANHGIRGHFTPNATHSQLYTALCSKRGGKCSFPAVVMLDADLRSSCYGDTECKADILRAVKIVDHAAAKDGGVWGYYTYVEPPCVRLQFFKGKSGVNAGDGACADPSVPSTFGTACCDDMEASLARDPKVCPNTHPLYEKSGSQNGDSCNSRSDWVCPRGCHETDGRDAPYCLHNSNNATCLLGLGALLSSGGKECLFVAEPMKFATAQARCASEYENGVVCPRRALDLGDSLLTGQSQDWQATCSGFQYTWAQEICTLQVQVYPSGEVGVVDRMAPAKYLEADSGSKFKVAWEETQPAKANGSQGRFPVLANGCAPGCQRLATSNSCLCTIDVANEPFVSSAQDGKLPTKDMLRAGLFIGASAPNLFGGGSSGYTLCTTTLCQSQRGVRVYTRGSSTFPAKLATDSIFEFTETVQPARPTTRSPSRYLFNRVSTVHVGTPRKYVLQDPRIVPIASCSASSSFHDKPVDPSGHTKCDEHLWPDVDGHICGDCRVLVDKMRTKYRGTCDNYCTSFGSTCIGAWDDAAEDTCADMSVVGTCQHDWGETSDAICECTSDGTLTATAEDNARPCESAYDGSRWSAHQSSGEDVTGSWIKLLFKEPTVLIDRMVYGLDSDELQRAKRVQLEFSNGSKQGW